MVSQTLKDKAGLHLNGVLNWMEATRLKESIGGRINLLQMETMAQERQRQDEEIRQFLLDMGAQVEQLEDGFLISLEGTQEKEAPIFKDAFLLWVSEVVMSRPGAPHRHLIRTKRNYQFPNNVWFDHDKANNITGWVTNVVGKKSLYGVVRYSVGDDQVAWVESPNHFNRDKDAAIKWCLETMKQLAGENWNEQ
jgi:hypothetical protein